MMDSTGLSHQYNAGAEYVKKMPSAPHIVVPPPGGMWAEYGRDEPLVGNLPLPVPYAFLVHLDFADYRKRHLNLIDWTYEDRRKAQYILPFLLLGPLQAAKDRSYLVKEGITMVIAVRHLHIPENQFLSRGQQVVKDLGIESLCVDVADNQRLISGLPLAVQAINTHLVGRQLDDGSTTGKVLIYCESGNERGAGLATAYLMESLGLDLVSSIQFIQSIRFCISIDDSLRQVLQAYDEVLKAKRDVGKSSASNGLVTQTVMDSVRKTRKRPLGKLDPHKESDDGVLEEDDMDRFEGRQFAPFVDP